MAPTGVQMTDWFEITKRNARSVQTTVGWIFWDPGATRRYVELGLPEAFAEPLGYIASRCAPLAGAGPDAVIASIAFRDRITFARASSANATAAPRTATSSRSRRERGRPT